MESIKSWASQAEVEGDPRQALEFLGKANQEMDLFSHKIQIYELEVERETRRIFEKAGRLVDAYKIAQSIAYVSEEDEKALVQLLIKMRYHGEAEQHLKNLPNDWCQTQQAILKKQRAVIDSQILLEPHILEMIHRHYRRGGRHNGSGYFSLILDKRPYSNFFRLSRTTAELIPKLFLLKMRGLKSTLLAHSLRCERVVAVLGDKISSAEWDFFCKSPIKYLCINHTDTRRTLKIDGLISLHLELECRISRIDLSGVKRLHINLSPGRLDLIENYECLESITLGSSNKYTAIFELTFPRLRHLKIIWTEAQPSILEAFLKRHAGTLRSFSMSICIKDYFDQIVNSGILPRLREFRFEQSFMKEEQISILTGLLKSEKCLRAYRRDY